MRHVIRTIKNLDRINALTGQVETYSAEFEFDVVLNGAEMRIVGARIDDYDVPPEKLNNVIQHVGGNAIWSLIVR